MLHTSPYHNRGMTLIEVVVVLGIISVLAAVVLSGLLALRTESNVSSTTDQVISALQLARSRALASVNEESYGVHLEADRYVLFTGTAYDSGDASNEVHLLDKYLEIANISIGGTNDVIFDRLIGTTSQAGSFEVRRKNAISNSRNVSILASGLVGQGGSVSPTGSAITDSRHLHFDLGWSIQDRTTMTLDFSNPPNPNVQEVVTMADYFNSDRTEFDWEGDVAVGSSQQTMRVHTHVLDAGETLLSIHRDRRYNDKALTISIDGQDIVSYQADGTATVGSDGGTMTPQ